MGIDLRNIGAISPNGTGAITVTSNAEVTGSIDITGTPAPEYMINGVPISFPPAGAAGQVQFNAGGGPPAAFGASPNLVWNDAGIYLGIGVNDQVIPSIRLDVNGETFLRGGIYLRPGGISMLEGNVISAPGGGSINFSSGGLDIYGSVGSITRVNNMLVVFGESILTGVLITKPNATTPTAVINSPNGFHQLTLDTPDGGPNSISSIFQSAPSNLLLNPLGGNVGIGTTNPTSTLSIVGLPTSSAGLNPGDLWNNGGVLNIV